MINYNLDCSALDSALRVEQLLTGEVKELIGKIAIDTLNVHEIDPYICEELHQARIVRINEDKIKLDTAVFLEDDLLKIHEVAEQWGTELAGSIIELDDKLPEMLPECKRLLIGMKGIDQGTFDILLSEGYAFNHRKTGGRYARAKIDFYEVCDAYDAFGPYLSGGYGFSGERFVVQIIGHDRGIYRYLNAGISLEDDEQYSFRTNVNKYLTDAIGELLLGEIDHPSLSAAAEAAGLTKSGKVLVPIITETEAPEYWSAVKLIRDTIREFLHSSIKEMETFLQSTLPGRQGVSLDKLIVDLMRYVRMILHKELYDRGFYTDSLLDGDNITVYRESTAKIDGK